MATPRTEALLKTVDDSEPFVEFSRQLERELAEARRWIPRAERMPNAGEYVLLTNGEWISTGYCAGTYFAVDCQHDSDPCLTPTHWMPLPEVPRG